MNVKLIVQGINSVRTVFVQIVLRQANGRHGLFIENHTNSRRRFMSYGLLRTFAQRGLVPVREAIRISPRMRVVASRIGFWDRQPLCSKIKY